MSEWPRAIAEVAQTVGIIVLALSTALTSIMAYLTRRDVAKVVEHTNSMKDELVSAVKEAATATGKEAGRKEVRDEHKE